jgi:hypothetical protein
MNPEVENIIIDNSKAANETEKYLARQASELRNRLAASKNAIEQADKRIREMAEGHQRLLGAYESTYGGLVRMVDERNGVKAPSDNHTKAQDVQKRRGRPRNKGA